MIKLNLTIYVDVLFLLNLVIDYIVIASTAFLTANKFLKVRAVIAACIGALYSTIIFFPQLKILNILIFKLVISAVIVIVAFGFKNTYTLIKNTLVFYIVNFIYGGGMYAFYRFTNLGSKMNYSNGEYYIDMPLWLIIVVAIVFYFLTKILSNTIGSNKLGAVKVKVEATVLDKKVAFDALIDTGNALYDPICATPVMLVESDCLKGVLTPDELNCLTGKKTSNFYSTIKKLKARIIPFYTATGQNSSIYAISAKEVFDLTNNRSLGKMAVGIVNHSLSPDKSYNALLNSKFYC